MISIADEAAASFERKQNLALAKKVLKQFENKVSKVIKKELIGEKPAAVFIVNTMDQVLGAGPSELEAWHQYEKTVHDPDAFQAAFLNGEFKRKYATRHALTAFNSHGVSGIARLKHMPELILSMHFFKQVHGLIGEALKGADIHPSGYKQTLRLPSNSKILAELNFGIESTSGIQVSCDFSRYSEERKLLNKYQSFVEDTKSQICCMVSNYLAREFNLFELRC